MTSFASQDNYSAHMLLTPADLHRAFVETVRWAERIWIAYAWASGAEAMHLTAVAPKKLVRVALGVDFCQTDPAVIRKLRETGKLRIVHDSKRVFHPKLLVAEGKGGWRAIIGSSNLTSGGFGRNIEVNVLLADSFGHGVPSLVGFIDEHWEGVHANVPNDEWLQEYERRYMRRPKPVSVPQFKRRMAPMPVEFEDLNVAWTHYVELIKSQELRLHKYNDSIQILASNGESYLNEIEDCRYLLEQHPTGRFEQLGLDERKWICGWPGNSSGYLGRMGGAGHFKKVTGSHPEIVGNHLDRLPLDGEVPPTLINEVVHGLWSIRGFGAGSVSRLLSVKRPDLFVPANKASFKRQQLFFGKKPDSPSKYFAMLKRIWQLPWFNSPEPSGGLEQRIWWARAALLDALFYVPTKSSRRPHKGGEH